VRTVSAGVGAIVGAAAGGAYYYFGVCRADPNGCARDQARANAATSYDQAYFGVGSLLVVGGMLVGGSIGYFAAPAPHWEIVPSLAQARDGAGILRTALRVDISYHFWTK
jgi:hypothetical protein